MNELIERYIHQVSRTLPSDSRDDVTLELRATIDDMVDAGGGADAPGAVREALIELGDPHELADRYRGSPRHLIGPEYYDAFRDVLKVVLTAALPVILVLQIIGNLVDDDSIFTAVGGAFWGTLALGVHICFWVTLVFALMERSGMSVDEAAGRTAHSWSPDDLPEMPPERQISRGDVLASVVVIALIPIALVWQHLRSPFSDDDGPIPLFDPDLWSSWFPVLLAIVAVNLAIEVWKYVVGRWTLPLVLVNLALNVAFVAWFVALFAAEQVWNPEYVTAMADQTDFVLEGSVVEPITIAVVVVISLWDTIESLMAYARRPREAAVPQTVA